MAQEHSNAIPHASGNRVVDGGPLATVHAQLAQPRPYGNGYLAFCPAHPDGRSHGRRSLHVWPREDGAVQVHCFAGCPTGEVINSLGLAWKDLYPGSVRTTGAMPNPPSGQSCVSEGPQPHERTVVATYHYSETQRVLRFEPKTFRPQHLTGHGEWANGKGPDPWPLYGETAFRDDRNSDVHLTEGEKDADTLRGLGVLAISLGSSSTPWRPDWTSLFVDRDVVIHADNDAPGMRRAENLAQVLVPVSRRVIIVSYPELPEHGDVTDFLEGHSLDELQARIASLPPVVSLPVADVWPAWSVPPPKPWPTLDTSARHGFAGEVLEAIEPHTEADPAALLITFLTLFGCALGRNPHMMVSGDRHGTNLFAVIVGDTAKARKGTSRAYPAAILTRADREFERRVAGGLVSGEGVVWAVRDPIMKVKGGSEVIEDEGIADKRLLVLEEEFSSVIKVASRDGNTSSETLRRAWDSRPMTSLAKVSPGRCEQPHIALIGHITKVELNRVMAETEAANGFANRILWVAARRSRLLPEGGTLTQEEIDWLALRTRERLDLGRHLGLIQRSATARRLWAGIYEVLSRPAPGMLGAMSARSEAHVLRLSLVYALLDGQQEVGVNHLEAAVALWDYCEASLRLIFGEALGNPQADRIYEALRNGPLSRTAISNLLGRNAKATTIQAALDELREAGKVRAHFEGSGSGRPIEVWEVVA